MNRLVLACLAALASGLAAQAEQPVRISPVRPAPASVATPSTNPAIAVSPQLAAGIAKYDPAKDIGQLKAAVAALQAQVAELQTSNAALQAKVTGMDEAMGKQFQVNLDQTLKLNGLKSDIAALKGDLTAFRATFDNHTHIVQDSITQYTNREVVTRSGVTEDEYTTIGSVTGQKIGYRVSSKPSTEETYVSPVKPGD